MGCAEELGKLVPNPDTPGRSRGTELEREQGESPREKENWAAGSKAESLQRLAVTRAGSCLQPCLRG